MANYLKNNIAESNFPAVYVLQMPGALLRKILKCSAECSLSTFDNLIGIYLSWQCHHKTNQYSVSAEINLPHKIPSHEKSFKHDSSFTSLCKVYLIKEKKNASLLHQIIEIKLSNLFLLFLLCCYRYF